MHTFKQTTFSLLATTFMMAALSFEVSAQDTKAAAQACLSTSTLDQLPQAFDDVISGPGDKDRTCLRQLLLPDMRLILMTRVSEGVLAPHSLSVDDWIKTVSKRGNEPLYEREVKVRTESFGRIAHLWCTYELRSTPDGKATSRGIVSIQAILDGKNWRLVEVLWQPERPTEPIPAKYLP
jgi:hypothetical protein